MNALSRTMIDLAASLRQANDQPRVFICSKLFHRGRMTAMVLIDREYFEVDERELALLQAGMEPSDLGLDPVECE